VGGRRPSRDHSLIAPASLLSIGNQDDTTAARRRLDSFVRAGDFLEREALCHLEVEPDVLEQ
jgi:hypothetical protein